MGLKRIPLGEWAPDQGDALPNPERPHVYRVYGAVNAAGGWRGSPGLLREALAGGSAPYVYNEIGGFHIHTDHSTANGVYFYVGTHDRLLRTAVNDATTATATIAGLANAFDTISGWQFASFGNTIVATQFGDTTAAFGVPMKWAATPTTNFADLNTVAAPVTYDPIARYVTTIKNHLLIGHCALQAALGPFAASTVYPELVMISATDNDAGVDTNLGIHRWGDEQFVSYEETIGSTYQFLSDNQGPITGVSGNGDYAYVFKPRAIWRVDGPPWSFHPVVVGAGTIYPNSIVQYYNDVYFWGPGGPSKLAYGSSEVEVLGLSAVSEALTNAQNSDLSEVVFEIGDPVLSGEGASGATTPIDISGVADYRNGLVAWFCGTLLYTDTTIARPSPVVVYDIASKQFSFYQIPEWFAFARSVPRYSSNPAVFNAVSAATTSQSPILDGTYGLTMPNGSDINAAVQIAGVFGDSSPALTYHAQPDEEMPRFVLPFQALEETDGWPVSTHVTAVRVPFTIERFGEEIGTNTTYTTSLVVTIRTKSSLTSAKMDTQTATFSLPAIDPDDWLPITGASGVFHQIEFKIQCAPVTAGQYVRPTSHIRNLRFVDVAYDVDGTTGGTLP